MWKSLTAGVICVVLPGTQVSADVLESFDYTAGSALAGQSGGSGWNGGWRANNGDFIVTQAGLDAPTMTGETGNAGQSNTTGRYQRTFDQTYDSGVVVLEFLMSLSSLGSDAYAAFELQSGADSDPGRVFQLGTLRGDDGGLTSTYAASSRTAVGGARAATLDLGDYDSSVRHFAIRFDLDADTATVFENPAVGTDLLTDPGVGTLSLFSGFSFDRVGIARFTGSGPRATFDEIRLTTVPEPGSMGLLLAGSLAMAARRRRG